VRGRAALGAVRFLEGPAALALRLPLQPELAPGIAPRVLVERRVEVEVAVGGIGEVLRRPPRVRVERNLPARDAREACNIYGATGYPNQPPGAAAVLWLSRSLDHGPQPRSFKRSARRSRGGGSRGAGRQAGGRTNPEGCASSRGKHSVKSSLSTSTYPDADLGLGDARGEVTAGPCGWLVVRAVRVLGQSRERFCGGGPAAASVALLAVERPARGAGHGWSGQRGGVVSGSAVAGGRRT
jgi:hypothetical protein